MKTINEDDIWSESLKALKDGPDFRCWINNEAALMTNGDIRSTQYSKKIGMGMILRESLEDDHPASYANLRRMAKKIEAGHELTEDDERYDMGPGY